MFDRAPGLLCHRRPSFVVSKISGATDQVSVARLWADLGVIVLVERCPKDASPEKIKTCENPKTEWTPKWTPNSVKRDRDDPSELPPDLVEIIEVWPELPVHIKAAIKALVQTHPKETTQ